MFSMIFQSLMGLRKSKCDVPNGTTQGWVCPLLNHRLRKKITLTINFINIKRCLQIQN
jgi:hypothetical protein